MTKVISLAKSVVLAGTLLATLSARGGTRENRIQGFRFQTCWSDERCLTITTPTAWVSQFNGGFSTEGAVELEWANASGIVFKKERGASAVYHPAANEIIFAHVDSTISIISLSNGNDEQLGSLLSTKKPLVKATKKRIEGAS